MAMQKKAWMIFFLFKKFLSFVKKFVPSGVFLTNKRVLINNHVTLQIIKHAQEFGLT
jgi:hypothetical protein